jgi:hypothetical protein
MPWYRQSSSFSVGSPSTADFDRCSPAERDFRLPTPVERAILASQSPTYTKYASCSVSNYIRRCSSDPREITMAIRKRNCIIRGDGLLALGLGALIAGTSQHAFASTGCDSVNDGEWDVVVSGQQSSTKSGDFHAGDVVRFTITYGGSMPSTYIASGYFGMGSYGGFVQGSGTRASSPAYLQFSYRFGNMNGSLQVVAAGGSIEVSNSSCDAAP